MFLESFLRSLYVIFAFCAALFFGALKSLLVGPVAGLILIIGNVGVILGLFPAHFVWTANTIYKTNRFDAPLKVAFFLGLPGLFGIWLGLSIAASVLVGLGYGFFAPWVSAFEAFRHDDDSKKFLHCVVDGTWGTIKGSCTVVRDFADLCYHSYPLYLKELRESPCSQSTEPLRLIHIPGCIIAGILGLIVEIPLYTAIAIVKSPFMLFKGWQRLIHDLISREGPFLETACIPIAGLTILLWPLVVVGSIIAAIFTSFFIGLYASIIVHQERSFRRGIAYVIAMVAEFDEYTNDWLYLREGSILPKPRYRKKKISNSSELPTDQKATAKVKFSSVLNEAPAIIVPRLSSSRTVKETIQEVKMVQVWGHMMRACEERGKGLLDADVITKADLYGWLKAKNGNENPIVDSGLPCYSFLQTIIQSINAGSDGLVLLDGLEVTNLNRPQDRLFDWFFHPILLLKEQIRVIQLEESEQKFLEKRILFGNDTARLAWDNGGVMPEDTLKAAQIEGISRRLIGMQRSIVKFPTYRRRFKQVVKTLLIYSIAKEESATSSASYPANTKAFKSASVRVVASKDMV